MHMNFANLPFVRYFLLVIKHIYFQETDIFISVINIETELCIYVNKLNAAHKKSSKITINNLNMVKWFKWL